MIDIAPELESFLKEEYSRCEDTTLEQDRITAIKRYNGAPYGDEEEGRSQVVARDTAEVTDYMVISILRTLVSGDKVVEFTGKDARLAQEITETVMHLFADEQDGYRVLHDWLKSGLLEKNSVAMTYIEEQEPKRRLMTGVSELVLAQMALENADVIEAEEDGEGEDGPLYKVVVMEPQPPKFCDYAIPNEEFYCSTDARSIDEALLKGRKQVRHISDLVAEGFDLDELEMVGSGSDIDQTLGDTRDDGRYTFQSERNGVSRQVWWHEEWARFDANGDGVAELLYIRRTGDFKVFAVEEMDEVNDHPFEDWCPFPMQHRRIGQSLADKTMDIERISTVLLRQSLDGMYQANMPHTYLHEGSIGETTIEDLLNPRVGGIVRWKGNVEPRERSGQFNAADGFGMLEYMAGLREQRTGITRLNQGLDAETLNKTATGISLVQAQGQQMEEYLARNFANALARLFTKKARLLKRFGKPIEVPIDGQYRQVDPSQWPDDILARPRIGLGASRKEQRLANRREIMAMQQALIQGGFTGLVDEKKLFNAAKGFMADVGMGEAIEYFNDPEPNDPMTGQPIPQPPKEPKPDPEMAKVQAEAAAAQRKQQVSEIELKARLTLQEQEQMKRQELARQQAEFDAKLARDRAAFEASLAEARAERESQLAQAKFDREVEMAERKWQVETLMQAREVDRQDEMDLSENRPGGDLDK